MHPVLGKRADGRDVQAGRNSLVTDHTPGSAKLEEVHHVLDILHPGLFAHAPAGRSGREPAPAERAHELGGTVTAEVSLEEILLLIVIVDTAEETSSGIPGIATAGGLGTGCQRELGIVVIQQAFLLTPDTSLGIADDIHTQHEIEGMCIGKFELIIGSSVPSVTLSGVGILIDEVVAVAVARDREIQLV